MRAAEALARTASGGGASPERKSASGAPQTKDADTRALEADLSSRLGLAVEIKAKGEQGELRVKFSNLEQLDDVCRRLSQMGSGAF